MAAPQLPRGRCDGRRGHDRDASARPARHARGLMSNDAVAERAGLLSGPRLAPVRVMQVGLAGLFAYSWLKASKSESLGDAGNDGLGSR